MATQSAKGSRRQRTMTLMGHLVELRKRLLIAVAAIIVAMVVAFFITEPIIHFITEPIRVVAEARGQELVGYMFTTVTAPFDLRFRISLSLGFFLSAPVWLWQVWAFVVPGLNRKEVVWTISFMAAAIPLFFAGCYVGTLVVPHVIELMADFTPEGGQNLYDASKFYDFVFKLMIAIGIAFVLPVFLVALNLAGVLSAKSILKGWRWAILIATVFAAIATPPADVSSMLILAGILVVLYFAAVGVAFVFDLRKRRRGVGQGTVHP